MDLSEINKNILTLEECETIHRKENVDVVANNGRITDFAPLDAKLKDSIQGIRRLRLSEIRV